MEKSEYASRELTRRYPQAEELLRDGDKMERFLQRLERKLKMVPVAGEMLAMVPVLVSLVRSYARREYTDVPIGTLLAVIAALLYWLSPIDLIPDVIPGVGHLDDAGVVAACLALVHSDVDEYEKWRREHGGELDD